MRKWGGTKKKVWTSKAWCVYQVLLTLSLQPCPGMRRLLCPPLLGWLCSWRSLLISSCSTESREWESKTLRHASHSSHCRHLSASTRPVHVSRRGQGRSRWRQTKEKGNKENQLVLCRSIIGIHGWSVQQCVISFIKNKVLARQQCLANPKLQIIVKTGYFQHMLMHDSYFQTMNCVWQENVDRNFPSDIATKLRLIKNERIQYCMVKPELLLWTALKRLLHTICQECRRLHCKKAPTKGSKRTQEQPAAMRGGRKTHQHTEAIFPP